MLFVIASLIVTLLVIPAALMIWLWQAQFSSKFNWLLNLLMVLVYYLFLLPIAFIIAASKSFINAKSLPLYPPKTFRNYLELGISAVVMMLFLASLKGYFFTGIPVELSFPLKNGTYYVAHGGNSPTINYHNTHPTQRYALDIMKLNLLGARANGFSPRSLTGYAIFGEPLYSPCNGTISNLVNDLPNLAPGKSDRKNLAGNHILLSCKGADILMAHLLSGSITKQVGSSIKIGEPIAKVGNSGNTSEPHLHIHARKANTGKSILDGKGLPITINGKFLTRNSILTNKYSG
jgi:Peptidase family M23